MRLLLDTWETPAENLALDEAILDAAEMAQDAREVLRVWEPRTPFIVLGRSSRYEHEVDHAAATAAGIPVLRRSSGGATIVAGPGCLMYAVVLSQTSLPMLQSVTAAHTLVLGKTVAALQATAPTVQQRGTSDLAFTGDDGSLRKFSGNSMRCKRRHVLYHGTLMYDFPLELITRLLRRPPREPTYRDGRGHADFVGNLPGASRDALTDQLVQCWHAAHEESLAWHAAVARTVAELVATRYSQDTWTHCF